MTTSEAFFEQVGAGAVLEMRGRKGLLVLLSVRDGQLRLRDVAREQTVGCWPSDIKRVLKTGAQS